LNPINCRPCGILKLLWLNYIGCVDYSVKSISVHFNNFANSITILCNVDIWCARMSQVALWKLIYEPISYTSTMTCIHPLPTVHNNVNRHKRTACPYKVCCQAPTSFHYCFTNYWSVEPLMFPLYWRTASSLFYEAGHYYFLPRILLFKDHFFIPTIVAMV